MRRSISTLGPQVLASRMVREYTTELYAPLARRADRLTADDHQRARRLARWRADVRSAWSDVAVRAVEHDEGVARIGDERRVEVLVHLGALEPDDVAVELLHGAVGADGALQDPAAHGLDPAGEESGRTFRYVGAFACAVAGEYGLSVRVVPRHDDLRTWTETGLVSWADSAAAGA